MEQIIEIIGYILYTLYIFLWGFYWGRYYRDKKTAVEIYECEHGIITIYH